MKLREHALRLFNMEEITGMFVDLFKSLVSQSSCNGLSGDLC
jgi:hypothetical protein